MTITYDIPVGTTLGTQDVILARLAAADRTSFTLVGSSASDNAFSADWIMNSGSADVRITMQTRRNYDPKRDRTSNSLRLLGNIRGTDSVTGEVTYHPVEALVAWNHEGRYVDYVDMLTDFVEIGIDMVLWTLTGANGTPTGEVLYQYNRDVVTKVNTP